VQTTGHDVSVAMPHWNEPDALQASCAAWQALYPYIELSICDDGSRAMPWPPGARMTALPQKDGALNPCVPFNAAVRASTRPILVLTNPGMIPVRGLLEALRARLTPRTYVAAACRDADTARWLCHQTVRGGEYGRGPMPAGAGFHFCAMLTRQLFDAAGGFDEDYRAGQAYDDNDFLYRLERAGAEFVIEDEVVIRHRKSQTVWPAGGLMRNRELFMRKWGRRWSA
jgi:hypothetical protein